MKVCPHCGDVYRDQIDFCFGDGEVLRPATAEEQAAALFEAPPPGTVSLTRPLAAPTRFPLQPAVSPAPAPLEPVAEEQVAGASTELRPQGSQTAPIPVAEIAETQVAAPIPVAEIAEAQVAAQAPDAEIAGAAPSEVQDEAQPVPEPKPAEPPLDPQTQALIQRVETLVKISVAAARRRREREARARRLAALWARLPSRRVMLALAMGLMMGMVALGSLPIIGGGVVAYLLGQPHEPPKAAGPP